jgi:hypothetical protein
VPAESFAHASTQALRYVKQACKAAGLTTPLSTWRWFAPVGTRIVTPTHDGSGQGMHPSVLYYPAGKYGFKYWMIMTPYPKFKDSEEDPNVLVSQDGNTWTVPAGVPVPLDDQAGSPVAYNSDGHLYEAYDGRLVFTWRKVDRTDSNRNIFYRRIYDGSTWTATEEFYSTLTTFMAQSLVRVGTGWRMYGINGDTYNFCYVETTVAMPVTADWGPIKTDLVIPAPDDDRGWWHSEIQKVGTEWWGIVSSTPRTGTGGLRGDIHLMRSSDGMTWEISATPITPRVQADIGADGYFESIDSLYKTGFVVSGSGLGAQLDIFLSGFNAKSTDWSTWRTSARII